MQAVVFGAPPEEIEAWLERRRALGQDGFDEVWEGVYHVAPMARFSRGYVAQQLARALGPYADRAELVGTDAFNLGEPDDFRVPDGGYHRGVTTVVYVPTAAIVVEVRSPGDETWEKFGFYARRGVEEICVADPEERTVRWFVRGPDGPGYDETDRSPLLGVTIEQVTDAIAWPPAAAPDA